MPRQPDPQLRRRLIAAATAEFAAAGYAGATLDAIAAAAGVTKGGLYFHFDGKEELFFAVLDHWRELRRRELQLHDIAGTSGAVALRRFLAAYLSFHLREPAATHLLRVLSTELRSRFTAQLREDDRQEQRWLRASIREALLRGARDGSLRVEDPALAAFVLASAVQGVLAQWHGSPEDVELHCDEELLARTLVAGFAAASSPGPAVVDDEVPRSGDDEFDFGRAPR